MKTWKAGDRFQLSKRLIYDYHTRAAGSRGTIHLPTVGGYFATFDDSSDTVLVKPEWIAPEWNFVWSNRAEYGPVINLMEKLEAEIKKPGVTVKSDIPVGPPPRPEIGSFWITFLDDVIVQIVNVYTPRGAKHVYVQWREVSKSRSLPATFTVQSTRHSARMREFWKMFTPTLQYTGYTELSEALEGFRKRLMDSHLPDRSAIEVELADALIRIFDLAGYLRKSWLDAPAQVNLGIGFAGKLDYNKTRADHSPEARAKADGKRF
jgi:hypothetical protein